jgi:hypothetical protein
MMDAHSEIFVFIFIFLMARENLSFQVPAQHEKKHRRQKDLVAGGTRTVCECLGHKICADKFTSPA